VKQKFNIRVYRIVYEEVWHTVFGLFHSMNPEEHKTAVYVLRYITVPAVATLQLFETSEKNVGLRTYN